MDTTREIDILKHAYSEFFGEVASWILVTSLMLLALAVIVAYVTIYVPRVLPKSRSSHQQPDEPESGERVRIRDDFDW